MQAEFPLAGLCPIIRFTFWTMDWSLFLQGYLESFTLRARGWPGVICTVRV